MSQPAIQFATQKIVCFALLFGMTAYAITAAVVLQMNGGVGLADESSPALDTMTTAAGIATAAIAIALRVVLARRADRLDGAARASARFTSVLLPLAMLEVGCLFAITVWLLNGTAVPALAVALVLLAIAISVVPFSDT